MQKQMNKVLSSFLILGMLATLSTALRVQSEQNNFSRGNNNNNFNTNDNSSGLNIFQQLMLARTANERYKILDKDSSYVFNFMNPPQGTNVPAGKGGFSITATRNNFPGGIGNGMSFSVGFIGPCGLNTPHIHPRATEMNYAVNGSFSVGFIPENGARQILNVIQPGTVAVFPKGSIHWEANLECESVNFVAAFDNEDPGVSQIAQNFFRIDPETLSATMGGEDIENLQSMGNLVPDNIAMGLRECLDRCGLSRGRVQQTRSKADGNDATVY